MREAHIRHDFNHKWVVCTLFKFLFQSCYLLSLRDYFLLKLCNLLILGETERLLLKSLALKVANLPLLVLDDLHLGEVWMKHRIRVCDRQVMNLTLFSLLKILLWFSPIFWRTPTVVAMLIGLKNLQRSLKTFCWFFYSSVFALESRCSNHCWSRFNRRCCWKMVMTRCWLATHAHGLNVQACLPKCRLNSCRLLYMIILGQPWNMNINLVLGISQRLSFFVHF